MRKIAMNSTEIVYMLLERKGWTQAKLSKELGYSSPRTLSNKLKRGNMTVETLNSILTVMGYEMVLRPRIVSEDEIIVSK